MTFLLDVNMLLALIDPVHVFHDAAHDWFEEAGHQSWATCPIVENGVIRILGSPRYPDGPGSPALAADLLGQWCKHPRHQIWPDEISLLNSSLVTPRSLTRSADVTDTYLLALAAWRGGRLATFDRRLRTNAVIAGANSLYVIA